MQLSPAALDAVLRETLNQSGILDGLQRPEKVQAADRKAAVLEKTVLLTFALDSPRCGDAEYFAKPGTVPCKSRPASYPDQALADQLGADSRRLILAVPLGMREQWGLPDLAISLANTTKTPLPPVPATDVIIRLRFASHYYPFSQPINSLQWPTLLSSPGLQTLAASLSLSSLQLQCQPDWKQLPRHVCGWLQRD